MPALLAGDLGGRRYWPDALVKLRDAIQRGNWKALLCVGPAKNLLEGGTTFDRVELNGALGSALRTLVDHAVHQILLRAHLRSIAWRDLMQPFDAAFVALQRERRLVRFDDIPRALRAAGLPGADAAHLAFRLDGCLDHVLLDEFQDTSTAQWTVLRPLVLRALQAGPTAATPARSLFCVGDVKQSIFGWRDAEPRLLATLAARPDVRSVALSESRRSAKPLMTVVNQVFGNLPANAAFAKDDVLREAATDWSQGLKEHRTALPDLHGAVRLWELPAGKDDNVARRGALLARAAAQLVARLVAADPQATIGVLVRRNEPIPRLILELRQLGVLASGEGGNPLTDSDSVQLLLSLLTLADHPGDRAAAFHVATSPLGPLAGVDFARPDSWRTAAAHVRRELLLRGTGAWLSELRDRLLAASALEDRERQRLGQLVDLGLAWDERATLRPGDFVSHVRHTPVEEPAASRVRVLTVHAAKGLEFDAVVCPELERQPRTERGLLLERPDPQGPITRVYPTVSRTTAERWPPAHELLNAVRRRALGEDLCVLYVALTRARRRLDLLVTHGGGSGHSFAKILRCALLAPPPGKPRGRKPAAEPADKPAPAAPEPVGPVLLFNDVTPGTSEPLLSAAHAPAPLPAAPVAVQPAGAPPPAAPASIALRRTGPGLVLRRRTPSEREGGGRRRVAELLALASREARARGAVVHAWMESLGWSEDPPPDEARLLHVARQVLLRAGEPLDESQLAGWLAWWRAALARPAARRLLSRAAAAQRLGAPSDGQPEVWRERRFLVVDEEAGGDGAVLVPGAFDRVVLAAGAAEIIDFKTDRIGAPGAPDAAALAARIAHYAPQMQAYRRALAQLTGLAPAAIECRLLFLEADVVAEVDAG